MKRLISVILAMIMLIYTIPITAFAQSTEEEPIFESVLNEGTDDEEKVEIYLNSEKKFLGTVYNNQVTIYLYTNEGVLKYDSVEVKSYVKRMTLAKMCEKDINLNLIYMYIEDNIFSLYRKRIAEEVYQKDFTNLSQVLKSKWDSAIKNWYEGLKSDTESQAMLDIIGVGFSADDLASSFYENRLDLVDTYESAKQDNWFISIMDLIPIIRIFVESIDAVLMYFDDQLNSAITIITLDTETDVSQEYDQSREYMHNAIRSFLEIHGEKI